MPRRLRAWWLVALALLLVSGARAGEVKISDEARARFRNGVELLKASRYEDAYRAFREAYALSPSPKILGNLGLCAMELERYGEAIDAYERYLNEAGAVSGAEEQEIVRDLVTLRGRVARVRLSVVPLDAKVVDERSRDDGPPVVNEYRVIDGRLSLRIREGRHRFTVTAANHRPASWELEARKGLAHEKTFELEPIAEPAPPPSPVRAIVPEPRAPDSDRGISPAVWAGVGVTAALVAASAIVGALALDTKSDFDAALEAGETREAVSISERGEALNIATDVLIGAAGAGGIVTVVLAIVLRPTDESAWTLKPSPTGMHLSGRF